jgi:hypothetical protein
MENCAASGQEIETRSEGRTGQPQLPMRVAARENAAGRARNRRSLSLRTPPSRYRSGEWVEHREGAPPDGAILKIGS